MNESKDKGTSVFQNGLVWFGAAVSIAEIEVGGQMAGMAGGGRLGEVAAAILIGHAVGGLLLFLVGLIGARARRGAMDCVKTPFGRWGAGFFALANIVQLLGWTAVMVAQGAQAATELLPGIPFPALAVGIGVLVAAWIFIGLGGVSRINAVAMGLLFALTAFLCVRLFAGGAGAAPDAAAASAAESGGVFWTALELSVAMPLSWLPLIADYTQEARRPVAAAAASATIYTVVSCWMYAIGLGVALAGIGEGFAASVRAAGVGLAGVVVVVFSTVTTTFLDAYSAGESAKSLWGRLPAKGFGVAVCALGTLLAIFVGMDHYLDFLYLIASVFAPMAAVQVVDWFVVGGAQRPRTPILEARRPRDPILEAQRPRAPGQLAVNLVAWLVGLAVYHLSLHYASPVGATLPAMAASAVIASFNCFTRHSSLVTRH